jgi:tetratricopeptide (TPR) repeat protein
MKGNSFGIRREWWAAIGIIAVVFWIYTPAFSAGYIWDDDVYVAGNRNLQTAEGLKRVWLSPRSSPQYYPLVFTSFWIERQLFGDTAVAHHAVNVLLHLVNGLLLWAILRRLGVAAAFVIAAIFAVHPVHVESVAWITERKNVLSGSFYLAAGLCYLHAVGLPKLTRDRAGMVWDSRWYAASLLLFGCALLSKTVTATLPVVLLLVLWWKRESLHVSDVLRLAPFFALGLAAGVGTAWLEVRHVGAAGEDWSLNPQQRVLLAGRVPWFYAGKVLWPHPLMFIYPRWRVGASLSDVLYPCALLLSLAGFYAVRRRIGVGPLFAVLFFIVTLFPAMGFVDVYPMRFSYVADHFQYLASIGAIALVVTAVDSIAKRHGLRGTAAFMAAICTIGLAGLARVETAKYHDVETLWRDTIAKNPDAWIAHNNLGNLRLQQRRWDDAERHFSEALRVKPNLAEAHNNLGTALYAQGDTDGAIHHYRSALDASPKYAEAWNNLGMALAAQQRYNAAVSAYEAAIGANPQSALARYNMGNVFLRKNDLNAANAQYAEAIRLDPNSAMAHYNLGLNLLIQGKIEEANSHLARAFTLKPNFAVGHLQVGNTQLQQGRPADAVVSYTAAIAAQPNYPEAYCNLATARLQLDDIEQAIADYTQALRLRPGYRTAEVGLARARGLRRQ